jgi:hypothetical protein
MVRTDWWCGAVMVGRAGAVCDWCGVAPPLRNLPRNCDFHIAGHQFHTGQNTHRCDKVSLTYDIMVVEFPAGLMNLVAGSSSMVPGIGKARQRDLVGKLRIRSDI